MSKKFLLIALLLFATAAFAYAADDDSSPVDDDASPVDDDNDAADDDVSPGADPYGLHGTANGAAPPVTLKANFKYTFAFDVFNTSGGSSAIKTVDISLPNTSYALDKTTLVAPTAIHPGKWTVTYADTTATITWQFQGLNSSAEFGDIKEGEDLVFPFDATTDKTGQDGFAWILTGDEVGNKPVVTGTFFFLGHEESPDDDASPAPHGGSSSGNGGGCGC